MGKSALALLLARTFDGEIVNADSRQAYRFMDIGTAKPSTEDRAQVRHHLLDVLDPDQEFSLATFLQLAHQAIGNIQKSGKLPIVTGGAGQYVWALVEGWQVPHVPPNSQLRQELEEEAGRDGAEVLHRRLGEVDPGSASSIDPRNLRRVIRALEIYHATGAAPSTLRRQRLPPYHPLIIGLAMGREALYQRIDRRVHDMLEKGLVREVRDLLGKGYSSDLPCMSGMGYKEIALHLRGELTLEEASQRIKYQTHRFARRQHTWFRRDDPRIHWLEAGPSVDLQAKALVEGFSWEGRGCGKIASTTEEKVP